jgi:hypothetical protein
VPVQVVVDQGDVILAVAESPESLHLEVGFKHKQLLDALAQQVLRRIELAAAVFRQVYCAETSLSDLLQDEHLLVSHLGSGIHLHGPLADKCNMLVWEVSRTDLDKVDAKLNRAFFATLAASVRDFEQVSLEGLSGGHGGLRVGESDVHPQVHREILQRSYDPGPRLSLYFLSIVKI